MLTDKKKFPGLSRFKMPDCYELSGRTVRAVMDDGRRFSLAFGNHTVRWSEGELPAQEAAYECLKADSACYLVHFQADAAGKLHQNWILDTDRRLTTLVTTEEGYCPSLPRLIRVIPFFGAIEESGLPLPVERHHFSDRMVGEHIFWHYSEGPAVQHIYTDAHYMRSAVGLSENNTLEKLFSSRLSSPDPEIRASGERGLAALRKRESYYPIYEEECFHIYISERLNLLCFVEENVLRADPEHLDGGGGILLLQDIERLIDMGVCFGAGGYYMCTAFGIDNPAGDAMDQLISPYDYSVCTSMPCIHGEIQQALSHFNN